MSAFCCPLCGEFEAPTAGAVKAHITGKSDETHKGRESTQFDEADLRDGDGDASSGDGGAAEPSGADAGPASEGGNGGDPVMEAPETPDDGGEGGCPECGSTDFFDPVEAADRLDLPDDHSVRDFDAACASCSEGVDWEVFDR